MRPLLWILNSYLAIIFMLSFTLSLLLKQTYIPIKERSLSKITYKESVKAIPFIKMEKIYENDLFDTYTPKTDEEAASIKLPPLPPLKPAKVTSIPVPPKIEPIPPLTLTLKGIMFASDNSQKSIALIEDETAKEHSYHLGNKIKDAQIVKIARDKVVLIRSNGQQETLLLRKDDNLFLTAKDKWPTIIKKIDENTFEIDLNNFKQEVKSLGSLLDALSLINALKNNTVVGVRIGKLNEGNIGLLLGLNSGDIIESINEIPTNSVTDRLKVISYLKQLNYGQSFEVKINRGDKNIINKYTLKRIKPAIIPPFGGKAIPDEKVIKAGLFELSPEQKKMQQEREFYKLHSKPERNETISDIRKNLLENMKRREQNVRIFN